MASKLTNHRGFVTLSTLPDLATDYFSPSPSTLSFSADTISGSSECFVLAAAQDPDVEGNHTLLLSLANATTGAVVGPLNSTLVTITDDGMRFLYTVYILT